MVNYREDASGMAITPSEDSALHEHIGYRAVKRGFDFVLSLLLIAVLFIPMLIIGMIIALDSRGGAVFRQKRIGLDGKEFYIYKFRTMCKSAPSEVATGDLVASESYFTRVGGFLRRTSVDELPQLFNVLKGDMSFVGPRPLIRGETDIHRLRTEHGVYSVRPGITGWAQVNGRDELSLAEKVRYDSEYVERRSILFDLAIIFRTIGVVTRGEGYSEGAR